MNARPLLTTALLVASAVAVLAADKCEPDCVDHDPGDKVADPRNCTQYYLCNYGEIPVETPLSCGSGNHFEPDLHGCVVGADCDPICPPGTGSCHMSCFFPEDIIADPKDCNKYYICDAAFQIGTTITCPPERPYYGGDHCVDDDSLCCQPTCTPYCGPDDVQIIDPVDCTKYYLCLEEGPVNETYHGSCGANMNYDVVSSRCVENAECLVLCDDCTTTCNPPTCEYICLGSGFYATSQTCQPEYFTCSASGECGVLATCDDGLVFNPDPEYPWCLMSSNCPYSPSV